MAARIYVSDSCMNRIEVNDGQRDATEVAKGAINLSIRNQRPDFLQQPSIGKFTLLDWIATMMAENKQRIKDAHDYQVNNHPSIFYADIRN